MRPERRTAGGLPQYVRDSRPLQPPRAGPGARERHDRQAGPVGPGTAPGGGSGAQIARLPAVARSPDPYRGAAQDSRPKTAGRRVPPRAGQGRPSAIAWSSSASSSSIFARGPAASGQSNPACRGAGTELSRACECRQRHRHVCKRTVIARGRPFLAFDLFPQAGLFRGVCDGRPAEHMRVAARELVADRIDDVVECECALLARKPGMEDNLEQQVAELVAQRREIRALDRVGDLVGFFERVRRDRSEVLLAGPRGSRAAGRAGGP